MCSKPFLSLIRRTKKRGEGKQRDKTCVPIKGACQVLADEIRTRCLSLFAIGFDGKTHWDGVRNYQARNMMRDEMKIGDMILYYHSNCKPPHVAGIARVCREGYGDFTSWDASSKYFDEKSTPEKPAMVHGRYRTGL